MNERYPRQSLMPSPSLALELPEMLPTLVLFWEQPPASGAPERVADWLVNAGLLEARGRLPHRLTPAGMLLIERLAQAFEKVADRSRSDKHDEVPEWNPRLRELRFQGLLVTRFRKSAPNQERVLAAFEEQGWPRRIDDPLPPPVQRLENARLHETIKRLNGCVQSKHLRFAGDGTGAGVCWRSAES